MSCITSDLDDPIHVGNAGIQFISTIRDCKKIAIDISSAVVKNMLFRKPDGTILVRTANFFTNGSDGKIEYTTTVTDLDIAGDWELRPEVDGAEVSTARFHVVNQWNP